jgi:hypothetical protein
MITAFVSLSPLVVIASLLLTHSPAWRIASTARDPHQSRQVEVRRIRAHFDSVLAELPRRGDSRLSAAQHSRRATLLMTLATYRDAGNFPHNYDFPEQPTPYFVDRKTGVLCAVAHLLESTGRRDIVDRVAAWNNNVYVADLAGDTAFVSWLDRNGLTLTEAARIQVPYMGGPQPDVVMPEPRSNASYTIGSAIAIGSSVATSLWTTRGNADGHRGLSNIAGFAASAVSIGVGAAALGDPSAPRAVAPLSLLAGGVSAWLSTRGVMRHNAYRTARRDSGAHAPAKVGSATVSPILPVAGVSGAGIAMRLTF